MNLFLFLLIEVALLALVHKRLMGLREALAQAAAIPPRNTAELFKLRRSIVKRFLLEAVRDALLVIFITIGVLFIAVAIGELLGRTTSDIWVGKSFLGQVRDALLFLKPLQNLLSLGLSLLGLILLARRAAAQAGRELEPLYRQAYERARVENLQEVMTEMEATTSDPYERTGESWGQVMTQGPVVEAREKLDQAWEVFSTQSGQTLRAWSNDQLNEIHDELSHNESASQILPNFYQFVIALQSYRLAIAESYINTVSDPDRQPDSVEAPADGVADTARLVINQSLHRGLRRTNRWSYYASLALLVPAFIGIIGDPSLRTSSIRLTQLAITRQEAGRNDEPAPTTVLSQSDRQLIHKVARQWEQHTFKAPPADPYDSITIHGPADPERPTWLTAEYQVRSGIASEAILYDAAEDANGPRGPDGRPDPKRRKRYEVAILAHQPDTPGPSAGSPGDHPNPPSVPPDGPILGGSDSGGPFATDGSGPKPGAPFPGLERGPSGASVLNTAAQDNKSARGVRLLLTSLENPLATQNPVTQSGYQVEADLIRECQRSETFLQNLRKLGPKLPPTTIRANEMRGMAIASLAEMAFDFVSGGSSSSNMAEVALALTNASPNEIRDLRDHHLVKAANSKEALLSEVRKGSDATVIFQKVEKASYHGDDLIGAAERRPWQEMSTRLVNDNGIAYSGDLFIRQPPSVHNQTETGVNEKQARAIVQDEIETVKKTGTRVSPFGPDIVELKSEALVNYNDYFPGSPGDDAKTERGLLHQTYFPPPAPAAADLPKIPTFTPEGGASANTGSLWHSFVDGLSHLPVRGSGGMGGGERPRISFNPGISGTGLGNAFRARSFLRLRGFTRIGGVLIGREPDPGGATSFTDFRWRWTPDHKIILTLVDASGKASDSEPYRPDLVLKALQYAADGRSTTATMVTASPIPSLRILLHPVLVDTPVGSQIQQLDRLVDTYALDSESGLAGEMRDKVYKSATYQNMIYNGIWFVLAAQSHPEWIERDDMPIEVSQALSQGKIFAAMLLKSDTDKSIDSFTRDTLKAMDDPKKCPLAAHLEWFDLALLKKIAEVGRQEASTWGDLREAIAEQEVDINKAPIKWVPWSGVREKPYKVIASELLMPAAKNADDVPFDFMWQVAFETPASVKTIDPWEQPELAKLINAEVPIKAAADPENRDVLLTNREFTYLQRLFRSAFHGWLGPEFPVQYLVDLHRAVRDEAPPYLRTLRWNNAMPRRFWELKLAQAKQELENSRGSVTERAWLQEEVHQYQFMLNLYGPLNLERDAQQLQRDSLLRELGAVRERGRSMVAPGLAALN